VADPNGPWGPLFAALGTAVAEAPPLRAKPLTNDELLALFASDEEGRNVPMEPARIEDMCDLAALEKPSLEVVYDDS
jgi:chlorophyllide a reductase subunit X